MNIRPFSNNLANNNVVSNRPNYQQTGNMSNTPNSQMATFGNLGGLINLILALLKQLQAQQQGQTSTPATPQPSNPVGFGNQTAVNVQSSGTNTSLNGKQYSNSFLTEAFDKFKNSDQYPTAQTRDFQTTPWGYQGSGSALTAFYNYVLKTYP